jgi:glycosyltransferase involved in cell wall biosynthesis
VTHNVRRRLVRCHPELASFFLLRDAATRRGTLATTVGDVVTVLDHLRHPSPALRASWQEVTAGSTDLRILVVDPSLPMYDQAAGSLRLFHILRLLREAGHHVTFLARYGVGQERYQAELEAMGIEVHVAVPPLDLAGLLRRGRFDVAWLDFFPLAEQYLPEIRAHAPDTRILVDTVDVHWLRQQRQAEIEDDPRRHRQAQTTRLREAMVYGAADGLIAVTADDERELRRLAPHVPTHVLGTVHPLEDSGPERDSRSGVVFVGNFRHPPNVDAALYLVREVMPLVWATHPAMSLTIVGSKPSPAVQDLAGGRVTVTGHVPDTRPYLDAARVSVAPLRFGAGMKGKVGEALAAGLPVVTTPIGAEGMGLEDGVHVLIADTAADLAASIIRLHSDAELWSRLSEGGRMVVERRYGVDAARSRLTDLLNQVMSRTAFVWVPDWEDEEDINDVLGSYAEAFSPDDPVALVVGLDTSGTCTPAKAVAALTASLSRIGRDPGGLANVAVTPFPAGRPEALLCPGAVWVPTGPGRFREVLERRQRESLIAQTPVG